MNWYLVMSKPREEDRAYENLVYQQYNCYLPKVKIEKIKQGKKIQLLEPLFPRYLFVQLNSSTDNWGPVRSTLGVSNMVRFGDSYAKVPDSVIEDINYFSSEHQESLFKAGES
ncbi:MAG: transcriptional activator RfaH [Betaproteobacteria bacterium]|nr:transcriptional activator RfaH [Betaproteobacteria bacterium]